MKIIVSILVGILSMVIAVPTCPEDWEPVLYWALPGFHRVFPPLLSGPSPTACLCCLLLNSVVISSVVFGVLRVTGRKRHPKGAQPPAAG